MNLAQLLKIGELTLEIRAKNGQRNLICGHTNR